MPALLPEFALGALALWSKRELHIWWVLLRARCFLTCSQIPDWNRDSLSILWGQTPAPFLLLPLGQWPTPHSQLTSLEKTPLLGPPEQLCGLLPVLGLPWLLLPLSPSTHLRFCAW